MGGGGDKKKWMSIIVSYYYYLMNPLINNKINTLYLPNVQSQGDRSTMSSNDITIAYQYTINVFTASRNVTA